MQPLPAVLLGHSPAACASPSSASRSRTRAASSREPGDARVARGGGGVHAHGREPERALDRPGGDVDELHPPVRDHRQAREEDAAADEQVVLALGVAPRANAPRDDDLAHRAGASAASAAIAATTTLDERAPRRRRARRREARRCRLRARRIVSRRGDGDRHAEAASTIAQQYRRSRLANAATVCGRSANGGAQ